MLLDNELFIPNAWFRFIPNPDMLHRKNKTKTKRWGRIPKINFTVKTSVTGSVEDTKNRRSLQGRLSFAGWVYLFMVKGWRAGCCLGIQMMLGELRLGLPSPELPILLVLPLIPMLWPTWEWFNMFLVFIGNVPLWTHHQLRLGALKLLPVARQLSFLFVVISIKHTSLRLNRVCLYSHLLGDGGVCRDMVGTPVVGVIWLGSCEPCVRFRFNWGVLFPMPLTEKPSAPADKTGRKTWSARQPRERSPGKKRVPRSQL